MAGLHDEVSGGRCGVQIAFPAAWRGAVRSPNLVEYNDPVLRATWEVARVPWRVSLGPASDATLVRAIAGAAREEFDAIWEELRGQPRDPDGFPAPERPRTHDGNWSPVIESGRVVVGGASATRIILRMSYQPGHELIAGRLLVPTDAGTVEIGVMARAGVTGFRESILYDEMMTKGLEPGTFPPDVQALMDDPAHDARFKDHPLSVVRASLAWLLDPRRGALQITRPPAPVRLPLVLPEARCSIQPPPLYALLPRGVVQMDSQISNLTRVIHTVRGSPELFSVWRTYERPGPPAALAETARRVTEGWVREGATIHSIDATAHESGASCFVDMSSRGRRCFSAQEWLVAGGAVFRVGGGGPPWASRDELQSEVRATARTLVPL